MKLNEAKITSDEQNDYERIEKIKIFFGKMRKNHFKIIKDILFDSNSLLFLEEKNYAVQDIMWDFHRNALQKQFKAQYLTGLRTFLNDLRKENITTFEEKIFKVIKLAISAIGEESKEMSPKIQKTIVKSRERVSTHLSNPKKFKQLKEWMDFFESDIGRVELNIWWIMLNKQEKLYSTKNMLFIQGFHLWDIRTDKVCQLIYRLLPSYLQEDIEWYNWAIVSNKEIASKIFKLFFEEFGYQEI